MRRRHSVLSCVMLTALGAALYACASSGDDTEHGPVYDGDGGLEATANDGTGDSLGDVPHDVPPESAADAPGDAPSEGAGDSGDDTSSSDASDSGVADASDASDSSDASDAGCVSTMAIVAGSASGSVASVYKNGLWASATTFATGVTAPPSIVAYANGYMASGVFANVLGWSGWFGSWSQPVQVASAIAQGTPALAPIGAIAHVVYWGTNDKFYHGEYSNNAWNSANDPVGGVNTQSFGPSAPSAAAVSGVLVVAQSGSDGYLYDQTYSGGSWQAASKHANAPLVNTVSPSIATMSGGNGPDAMIVYARASDYHLMYTTRSQGNWTAPAEVYNQNGNIAYSSVPVSLAGLPSGAAIVAWLGGNGMPYYSSFNGSTWSAPATIVSANVASAPSVAPGVCGADAAAVVVKSSGGEVDALTWTGGTWSSPTAISGATNMTYAVIATSP